MANTVGSSVNLIRTTYAHDLMTSEVTARSLYEQQLRRGDVGQKEDFVERDHAEGVGEPRSLSG